MQGSCGQQHKNSKITENCLHSGIKITEPLIKTKLRVLIVSNGSAYAS